ncbi:hypothetical protein BDV96DRAFT_502565 [Lophiotrema nucula]|uniref:Alpha-type protein kinase domain-containing protein n=1 Tax=Lophiotrema nucula TaxID=690887 RepID=A0A6A5YRQ1_9PLEO|nr:hypothetical protein BDV96DRAFT_502565 [Lophiotrema nucula]
MRRAAEKEHALAERLKREGNSDDIGVSAFDAESRLRELKRDRRTAENKSSSYSTKGMFKAAYSTDLLFLVDTTGSMQPYIDEAKKQVLSIADEIKREFLNDAEVRIAVVAYKDHADTPNVQFLDFTPEVDMVRTFIAGLYADGGGDTPEDVLGGLQQAINASWKQQTRCIVHIADSPPHGRTLHDLPDPDDDYPQPGSEPHHLTFSSLLTNMIALSINYTLLRITNLTDRMAFEFFREYLASSAAGMVHVSNRYYSEAYYQGRTARSRFPSPSRASSLYSTKGSLNFEELELGTSYSALRGLVVRTVSSSASRTAVRLSATPSRRTFGTSKLGKGLSAIKEDEKDTPDSVDVRLDTSRPHWDRRDWLDETLMVEGFSPDVGVHSATTLDEMMMSDDNFKMSVTVFTIRKRSTPFAQGAFRVAFYARTRNSTTRYVVKSFKRKGKKLAHLTEEMRCQALCKAFALEFNAFSGEVPSIDFLVTTCLEDKAKTATTSGHNCLSLEPFIEGTYVKYNGNRGYVNSDIPNDPFNQAAQAFSHFTFERSKGQLLVSDLQGSGSVFTDPIIHTLDHKRFMLSDGNLGEDGFKFFFATHVCNDICRRLQLKSTKYMFASRKFEFRQVWPAVNNTTCCANVLCGHILRLFDARRSDKYPGHYWCPNCWPQLEIFTTKMLCVAPGLHHEFEVSTFFYESQGQRRPRKCPEHRGEGDSVARVATMTTSAWERSKTAMSERLHSSPLSPEGSLPRSSVPTEGLRSMAAAKTRKKTMLRRSLSNLKSMMSSSKD